MIFQRFLHLLIKNRISVSYCITVCNEVAEFSQLVDFLEKNIDKNDKIVVLQDITNENKEVTKIITAKKDSLVYLRSYLNNDFATFKNQLLSVATKKYIFQIDADEMLYPVFFRKIKLFLWTKSKYTCFQVPRINKVQGITNELLQKWNWTINNEGHINFPDYQLRIFKNNAGIVWANKVHEILIGCGKTKQLPIKTNDYCLLHYKEIEKQKSQNKMYESIETNAH